MTIHNNTLFTSLPHTVPIINCCRKVNDSNSAPLKERINKNLKPIATSVIVGAAAGAAITFAAKVGANLIASWISRVPFNYPKLENQRTLALLPIAYFANRTFLSLINLVAKNSIPKNVQSDLSVLTGFGMAYSCGVFYPKTVPTVYAVNTLFLAYLNGMKFSIFKGHSEFSLKAKAVLLCTIGGALASDGTVDLGMGALGGLCGYIYKKLRQR